MALELDPEIARGIDTFGSISIGSGEKVVFSANTIEALLASATRLSLSA